MTALTSHDCGINPNFKKVEDAGDTGKAAIMGHVCAKFGGVWIITGCKEVTHMKKNMGTSDRVIRLILGIIIIAVGVFYKSWWGAVGLVPIFTALVGWCGLYTLLGISTSKAND